MYAPPGSPRLFSAAHIRPVLVALLLGGNVWIGLLWYGLVQLAVTVTLATPLYLRRPTASALTVVAIVLSSSVLPLGEGLGWFIPCLFVKLVLGHAVREEPYAAPARGGDQGLRQAEARPEACGSG